MVTGESRLLMRIYRHWRNGVMPRAGGLLDQPNRLIEAMELIEARTAPPPQD